MEPAFSDDVYAWERELMGKYFLRRRMGVPEPEVSAALEDLAEVGRRLEEAPRVLVHRDMQSSNVLLRRAGPVFIDFQGMRAGPAVYDLASLLCDPYVMLPPACRHVLLEYYAQRAPEPDRIRKLFWWAAAQRLSQALGAFSRLDAMPGVRGFGAHICPGLAMLEEALSQLDGLDRFRALVTRCRLLNSHECE